MSAKSKNIGSTVALLAMIAAAVIVDIYKERSLGKVASTNVAPVMEGAGASGDGSSGDEGPGAADRSAFQRFAGQFPPAAIPFELDGGRAAAGDIVAERGRLGPEEVGRFIARDTSFGFRGLDLDSASRERAILDYRIRPIARVTISRSVVGLVYLAQGGAGDSYRLMLCGADGTFRASLPFASYSSEGRSGIVAEGRVEMVNGRYRVRNKVWRWRGHDVASATRTATTTREWIIAANGTVTKGR